jgi:hypothetical protein
MTARDQIACDGLGCTATLAPKYERADGWMAVIVNEFATNRVYNRHADLCPVHAQAFLDICGPLPRRS